MEIYQVCDVQDSHMGVDENSSHLGCHAVLTGIFCRSIVSPSWENWSWSARDVQ